MPEQNPWWEERIMEETRFDVLVTSYEGWLPFSTVKSLLPVLIAEAEKRRTEEILRMVENTGRSLEDRYGWWKLVKEQLTDRLRKMIEPL